MLWCSFELSLHSSRCPVCLLIGCGHGLDCMPAAGLAKRAGRDGAESGRGRGSGNKETRKVGKRMVIPKGFFACFLGCSLPTNSPEEEHARTRTSLLPVLALRKVTFGVRRRQRATRERASGNKVRILFCCNVIMLAHSTLCKMTRGYSVGVAGVLATRVISWKA